MKSSRDDFKQILPDIKTDKCIKRVDIKYYMKVKWRNNKKNLDLNRKYLMQFNLERN